MRRSAHEAFIVPVELRGANPTFIPALPPAPHPGPGLSAVGSSPFLQAPAPSSLTTAASRARLSLTVPLVAQPFAMPLPTAMALASLSSTTATFGPVSASQVSLSHTNSNPFPVWAPWPDLHSALVWLLGLPGARGGIQTQYSRSLSRDSDQGLVALKWLLNFSETSALVLRRLADGLAFLFAPSTHRAEASLLRCCYHS